MAKSNRQQPVANPTRFQPYRRCRSTALVSPKPGGHHMQAKHRYTNSTAVRRQSMKRLNQGSLITLPGDVLFLVMRYLWLEGDPALCSMLTVCRLWYYIAQRFRLRDLLLHTLSARQHSYAPRSTKVPFQCWGNLLELLERDGNSPQSRLISAIRSFAMYYDHREGSRVISEGGRFLRLLYDSNVEDLHLVLPWEDLDFARFKRLRSLRLSMWAKYPSEHNQEEDDKLHKRLSEILQSVLQLGALQGLRLEWLDLNTLSRLRKPFGDSLSWSNISSVELVDCRGYRLSSLTDLIGCFNSLTSFRLRLYIQKRRWSASEEKFFHFDQLRMALEKHLQLEVLEVTVSGKLPSSRFTHIGRLAKFAKLRTLIITERILIGRTHFAFAMPEECFISLLPSSLEKFELLYYNDKWWAAVDQDYRCLKYTGRLSTEIWQNGSENPNLHFLTKWRDTKEGTPIKGLHTQLTMQRIRLIRDMFRAAGIQFYCIFDLSGELPTNAPLVSRCYSSFIGKGQSE